MLQRPRRNRRTPSLRNALAETHLGPEHLVSPLFVHADSEPQAIKAMPGQQRHSQDSLLAEIDTQLSLGIDKFVFFPAIAESLKNKHGSESSNSKGLIPTLLHAVKSRFPELTLITDVALDPYSSDGHDGVVGEAGTILNDETVEILCKQALSQARAGADIIAPSDMMDGRVLAIRQALESEGFDHVGILSYSAKYASAFYGPFRDALDSAPKSGDKKTYQMDPRNSKEALLEAHLDTAEGADILMVKPALAYLDILKTLSQECLLPLAAYHVSGQYSMVKAAAHMGYIDEKEVIAESLIAIRRAGASLIFTYFARDFAEMIKP